MTTSMKAALLSALVFPGVGHLYLNKHMPGIVLALAGLGSLGYIGAKMVERTMQVVDQVLLGQVQPDVATITELVSKQAMGSDAGLYYIAWAVFLISWLIGIADAYRLGRLQGKSLAKQ